jgi:hypothetical protein
MFAPAYFPGRYFAPSYFPGENASAGIYFAGYFAGRYFAPAYFPGRRAAVLAWRIDGRATRQWGLPTSLRIDGACERRWFPEDDLFGYWRIIGRCRRSWLGVNINDPDAFRIEGKGTRTWLKPETVTGEGSWRIDASVERDWVAPKGVPSDCITASTALPGESVPVYDNVAY